MAHLASVQAAPAPRIDDSWRSWIAENLMLGGAPQDLARVLASQGFHVFEIERELQLALSSPYLRGVRRLQNRIAKRDWLLGIQQKLNRLRPPVIERRAKLSREAFLHDYYAQNRPVIITGMMEDWPALQKWNLDWLAAQFGAREVEVQFGRNADANYELNSIAHKKKMRFGEYCNLVRTAGATNDFYMTANNDSANRQALIELWQDIVQLPEYLRADDAQRGFFWFGPAGTITPFHHDLTNNFMAQVMGRKRVKIMAACDTPLLRNFRHCFTEIDGRNPDPARWTELRDVQIHECVLEPGEILFLPVGCWHFVEGLDISITIAFTNFLWDNDFFSNYPQDHDF
ncbi:cupin-like domain-containing protein [Massilia sp. W12]|uniref:cupin-like domain-containing protein n=1 Tax=Massilia sp. W12 TaxID=3126507 RepID=UPI0030D125CE